MELHSNIRFMLDTWNEGASEEDKATAKDLLGKHHEEVVKLLTDEWVPSQEDYDPLSLPDWTMSTEENGDFSYSMGPVVSPDGQELAVIVSDEMYASYFLFCRKA